MGGSVDAFFAPFGRETVVSLQSDWQAPSFQGAWLPSEREFGEEGFSAEWNVASLGRNYPQDWNSQDQFEEPIQRSLVGVAMISPVDEYRMAHRSVKYQFLFLVLTFVALWMFEIRIPLKIHSIQYLFVGAALCLFYLLELSLAEHVGFLMAYIIASAAVVGLIAAYAWSMLRTLMRAFLVGLVVALLYGFLYILLTIQDVALLVGSVGLFVALASVMYLTRNMDWNLLADEAQLRRKIVRE
jgi:inner membrane protein